MHSPALPPHDDAAERAVRSGTASYADAARAAALALVASCVAVVAALWIANRGLTAAADALPPAGADVVVRYRTASWLLGAAALGALVVGLVHGERMRRRAAARATELERLSAELIRANRAKSEFLANVSHELRTPLNAVVGFAELMQDGVYGELAPAQIGPVRRIATAATHLRHIVDQILDLARIAAGRLEVHTESVALRPFVLEVAGEIESLVQDKGLALSIAVPHALPRLRSDPLHVRQVLVNLLGNAVKFTPSGGRVAVRASLVEATGGAPPFAPRPTPHTAIRAGMRRLLPGRHSAPVDLPSTATAAVVPWIALQVVDTGVGIRPSDQARIFDEFEQLGPRTGDGADRGTGLGLAISRRLAQLLGGDLTLESAPGRGSTFTLWLPVDPVDVPAEFDPADPDHAARPPLAGERQAGEPRAGGRRRSDHEAETTS
ncbi:MAG TPA: ATP-binding protein [Gemmatirosa sp.]